jgi:DNA replication licensing factor MCM2
MEQQTISISKAGIVTTLRARCSVIAAANPVKGRYDSSVPFSQNVDLTDAILSRFDITCVIRDIVDQEHDARLAKFVIESHARGVLRDQDAKVDETDRDSEGVRSQDSRPFATPQELTLLQPISQDILRKYIMYSRAKIRPRLHGIDSDKLLSLYAEMRAESEVRLISLFSWHVSLNTHPVLQRGGGVPMTVRHFESMIRMAEAHAKMHLRETVEGTKTFFNLHAYSYANPSM